MRRSSKKITWCMTPRVLHILTGDSVPTNEAVARRAFACLSNAVLQHAVTLDKHGMFTFLNTVLVSQSILYMFCVLLSYLWTDKHWEQIQTEKTLTTISPCWYTRPPSTSSVEHFCLPLTRGRRHFLSECIGRFEWSILWRSFRSLKGCLCLWFYDRSFWCCSCFVGGSIIGCCRGHGNISWKLYR